MAELYPHAPIVEAVIELRTQPVPLERVKKAARRITKQYALQESLLEIQIAGMIGVDAVPKATQTEVGVQATSGDATDVVMVKVVGLTVTSRSPYLGWGGLIGRLERDWADYVRLAKPGHVDRIGVRFINRIDVPTDEGPFARDEYILITPGVPLPMDAVLKDATTLVVAHLSDTDLDLRIHVGEVEPVIIKHRSFLLDIDLYRDHEVPQQGEEIWPMLARMRDIKNQVFESLITDKARALFR